MAVEPEVRTVIYDTELTVEAYRFQGIMQKFPNHFHDYYVIGFIENGRRYLSCKNKEYTVEPGDLLLFNPRDNHTCEQIDGRPLDYRCINVQPEIMRKAALEITGREYLPYFTQPVVFHSELVASLRELHAMILAKEPDFRKEERFFWLLGQLMAEYTDQTTVSGLDGSSPETERICEYLENNYTKNITLNELSTAAGVSKYYLLRSFTKQKGISPYSYLATLRVTRAKQLLEQGVAPLEAGLQTGFADQSHFTHFFKKLIGLTPRQYKKIFEEPR